MICYPVFSDDIQESKIHLENFKNIIHQNTSYYIIDVTGGTHTVAKIHFGEQPGEITDYLRTVEGSTRYDIGVTTNRGEITVTLDEYIYNDATLIVFLDDTRKIIGYICLMRQSEEQLIEKFNFTKKNGYTVIGRTSLNFLPNKTYQLTWNQKPVDNYPDLTQYYPDEKYPQEIREVIALLRFFWKEPMETGPSNVNYRSLSVDKQIDYLESEKWTIQCGEIRDIVASYAMVSQYISGVKIINAEQYCPRFYDLTGNTHGVMEIYLHQYNRWVLVDPMFGSLFSYKGELIGVDTIKSLSVEERKNIVPIKVAGNSLSLEETFNGYYLNQNYYMYYNTINYKVVKFEAYGFDKLYYKTYAENSLKTIGEIL